MRYKKNFPLIVGLSLMFSAKSFASDQNLEDIKDIRGETNHYYELSQEHPGEVDINLAQKKGNLSKYVSINENTVINDLKGRKFVFSSGAGGWQTILNFSEDGKFKGEYMDYDIDRVIKNDFEGQFVVDSKVNETCYILKLINPKVTSPTGETYTAQSFGEDVKGEYVDLAYGFEKISPVSDDYNDQPFEFQDKFTLYTPFRLYDEMSPKVNEWLQISGYKDHSYSEVYRYILVNNSTIETFKEPLEY